MERIQEAIEKARKERQGAIGGVKEQQFQSKGESIEGAPLAKEGADSSIHVKYSETRTVELNEAELIQRRIVAGFAHDASSEPYRQLRGIILKRFREQGWSTLAVTSPNTGAGKTLTAVNLAISMSLETNQTVMLVDLNLRNPGVAHCFGIENIEYGVVDYVKGEVDLSQVLINPGYERLVVLPSREYGAFSSEVLTSPEMNKIIKEIVERYKSRIIIFDLPSVLDHDDALVFAPKCDATLMIIEEGGSSKEEIERAYNLLEGANIIGSVFNKVKYA